MKRFVQIAIIAGLVAGVICAAEKPPDPPSGIRLWLVLDTSYNQKSCWDDIEAIGRSAIRTLIPGDRIRVIVGTKTAPSVLLLEQITADENVRAEVIQTLEGIKPGSFSASDLAKALGVPLAVMEKAESRKSVDLVLLLTSGKMEDDKARAMLEVHDKLIAAGAYVVVTGVHDSSPILLLAAARGKLAWREIGLFDPAEWIAECRAAAGSAPTPEASAQKTEKEVSASGPATSGEPLSKEQTPPVATSLTPPSPVEAIEVPVVPTPPELSLPAPKKVVEVTVSVSGSGETKTEVIRGEVSPPTSVAPLADEVPSQTRPEREEPSASAVSTLPPITAVKAPEPSAPSTPGPAPSVATESPSEAPVPDRSSDPGPPPALPMPSSRGILSYWYVLGPIALLGLVVGVLVMHDVRRGRQSGRETAVLPVDSGRPLELVARFGGTERVLGRAELLQRFHIGSGFSNALRISEDGVEEQHVELRRDRAGVWTIQNLSHGIFEVSGTALSPGKSVEIDFPAAVKLAEGTSLTLFTRPIAIPTEAPAVGLAEAVRSTDNG